MPVFQKRRSTKVLLFLFFSLYECPKKTRSVIARRVFYCLINLRGYDVLAFQEEALLCFFFSVQKHGVGTHDVFLLVYKSVKI